MKVQIVQLEAHDDLASVSDKLAWAQAPRVVLVWPDRTRVLRRSLDLALLRRFAAARGIQIGVVTRDPVALEQAATLGIPTFRSSTRLPDTAWGQPPSPPGLLPSRPTPRPPISAPPARIARALPAWLRIALAALVAASILGALVVILPSATITLSPELSEQAYDLTLALDPGAEAPNEEGVIPARQMVETVSGSIRVTTTGTTKVASRSATGQATFTNQTDEPVLIPAGTGILPSGRPDLRFETTADLSLPAGKGATAAVRVIAATPGSAGNLPAGSLNAIDGPLGLRSAVSQPEPLAGGAEGERSAVAAADQAIARRLLTDQLLAQAAANIQAQLGPQEVLAENSVRVVKTLEVAFDREIGSAGDSVGLELTLQVAALTYRQDDLDTAVDRMLARTGRPERVLVPGSRQSSLAEGATARPDAIQVHVTAQAFTPVDPDGVRLAVRGRRLADASARLSTISGQAEPPQIGLRPSWWPFLPWLDVRIDVRYPWGQP